MTPIILTSVVLSYEGGVLQDCGVLTHWSRKNLELQKIKIEVIASDNKKYTNTYELFQLKVHY